MIVPDTNLLIYAHDEDSPWHARAMSWWENANLGNEMIGIPWIVSVGFLRITTHVKLSANPLPPVEAISVVEGWYSLPSVLPLNPGAEHCRHLRKIVQHQFVTGNLMNDAHIAAMAIEHGACIHSNDSDFTRFPGVQFLNPLVD